jgi:Sigma-70, region 4
MRMPPESDEDPSGPSAAELVDALSRLPPRSSQLLGFRVLDGRPDAECARLYGVSEAAIAVHVLRAARLLEAALASPGKRMLPSHEAALGPDDEEQEARALLEGLDRADLEPGRRNDQLIAWVGSPSAAASQGSSHGHRAIEAVLGASPARLLLHLRALAPEVRRLADAKEREEANSPERRRAEWLRRLALVALVALALWLYLR